MVIEKEFSVRKFSGVSGSSGEAELKILLESIDIPLRGLTVVRPVHSTVLSRSHCFQITTPSETRYFTCNSAEDANNWVAGLKEIIYPNRNKERRVDTSLDVWIFEAKGLPSKKKYYCEIVLDKVLYGRTSTKLKSDILFWGEQFSFDDLPNVHSLSLYVFKENETKKKRKERIVFVGAVEVPLHSIQANNEIETWLYLHPPGASPKPPPKNSMNKNDQLSVRVKVKYQTVSILPVAKYKELHEFIKRNNFNLCKELESIVCLKAKDELAQTLLRILQVTNQAKEFLAGIVIAEVNTLENENLTFRGNTLATKSMDTYMKMVGYKYLHQTLAPFIESLYNLEQDVEVDPARLTSGSLAENQKNLLKLVEEAWSTILASCHHFPKDLQDTFRLIKQRCETLEKDVSMKLISGSVFLRFLCPAILSPSLFHLTREYPDERTARCLTLIAKALQTLANFTRFGGKEAYMEGLNEFVERELPNMKKFLDVISSDAEVCEHATFDGYIDLGRELAVIKNLISEQMPKMKEDSKLQLDPLCSILSQLDKSEDSAIMSDFGNSRDTNEFDKISYVSSYRQNKLQTQSFQTLDNQQDVYQHICYKDAPLSVAQDYVSGCSLILHTPLKAKDGISRRTKGRGSEMNNQLDLQTGKSNNKSSTLNSRSLFRGDEFLTSTEQSQFSRSSSFHCRSSKDEKQSILKSTRSFDTDILLNQNTDRLGASRHWLNTSKSESRLRTKSDQSSRARMGNGFNNSVSSDKISINTFSNSSLNNDSSLSVDDQTKCIPDITHDGHKTIRRLPDIIHQSIMWNEGTQQSNKPLYFSPATEPMTPLGNRQFKFGVESLNQLQKSYDIGSHNKDITKSPNSNKIKSFNNNTDASSKSCENLSFNFNDCKLVNQIKVGASQENVSVKQPSSASSLDGYASDNYLNSQKPNKCFHDFQDIPSHETDLSQSLDASEIDKSINQIGCNTMHGTQSDNHSTVDNNFPDESQTDEIKELRQLLQETQIKLQAKEMELAKRTRWYEQNILSGKKKLEEAEKKLQSQKKDKEEQMKSIISRLTNVESELRREQSEMQDIVQAKQKIIEVQEKRIRSLDAANRRLVSALNQHKTKNNIN